MNQAKAYWMSMSEKPSKFGWTMLWRASSVDFHLFFSSDLIIQPEVE
jgi:hypothetical protein